MIDKNRSLIELCGSPDFFYGKILFDEQSEPQQVFTCIWELETDVNNGGFAQYYYNSSGDTAFRAVWALEAIGARHAARIVRLANGVFENGEPPRDRADRQEQTAALPDWVPQVWAILDRAFMDYPDDLTELLYVFVHRNAREFGLA